MSANTGIMMAPIQGELTAMIRATVPIPAATMNIMRNMAAMSLLISLILGFIGSASLSVVLYVSNTTTELDSKQPMSYMLISPKPSGTQN